MVEVNDLLNRLLLVAKYDRAKCPYSQDDSFMPKVIFIGPNSEIKVIPMTWRDEREKYAMMDIVAQAAQKTLAQAIALVSDTRWLKSDVFCDYFKIDPPKSTSSADVEAFQNRYYAILRQYDGQIKNLPRQLWNEAVMVLVKGPRCGTHSLIATYTKGPDDTVLYLPPDANPLDQSKKNEWIERANIIPEWWQ